MKNEKFVSYFITKRKQLGYSQNKIASELGISDQAVSNWERGVSFPDLSYLDDIAKLLKTNISSLIDGKEKNVHVKNNIYFDVDRLSNYLTKLRKNKNLTQNELGKILNISGQNISKFENGGFLPSIEIIEKYAKYFNVSFMNIYYGLDDCELLETNKDNKNQKNIYKLVISISIAMLIILIFIMINLFNKKHMVTIILDNNEVITFEVQDEENITLPEIPEKKGYYGYWDITDTIITENKTFTVIYEPKKYTITYKFDNEKIEDYIQEVTYNETFKLYNPIIKNYSIVSYTYNDSLFSDGIYSYDYDIIVNVSGVISYTVTIILDAENIETYAVIDGSEIILPELPEKKGYSSSWDITDTIISEDKTFTVIYTPKKYTITYFYDNDIIESFNQEVLYGEKYYLYIPSISNYSFMGYKYNDELITDGIFLYDHNITIYGVFSNDVYEINYEYSNCCFITYVGYNTSYKIENYSISDIINDSSKEYENYKIIGWKDTEGNIYEVNKTYIYSKKENSYLVPIFEYNGNGFEVTIENNEAKIIKYNINKIFNLIIPDYIIIEGVSYKVTSIESNSFQDIYFMDITLSSNITKIAKNAFNYENVDSKYLVDGYIYYNGSLLQWFNIEFEDYIVSNSKQCSMRLYTSFYLCGKQGKNYSILEIPNGVQILKTYSCANIIVRELIIPNSVHTIEENAFKSSIIDLIINLDNVQNVHDNAFN